MADDVALSLPAGWSEARFERGQFGPEDRPGLEVAVQHDGGARIEVLPVRYRREDGEEYVHALTQEFEAGRNDPSVPIPDVAPRTAFATRLTYTPFDTERQEVACVAAEAGDALAVAVWLLDDGVDSRGLRRHVNLHAGSGAPTGASLSDDDVLAASFADGPERCVYTAKETRSHHVELPYRYAPVLSAVRRTNAGVPRFPSTVSGLVGVVSHEAWVEHGLEDVDFTAPIERVEPGEYRLAADVVDAVAGADADSFALVRLGAGE